MGAFVAATEAARLGQDRSRQPWFQGVRTHRLISVNDPALSLEVPGSLAITISAPLRDKTGAFDGAMVAQVKPSILEDVISQVMQALQAQVGTAQHVEWQIVNRSGELLRDSHLRQEDHVNLLQLGLPSTERAATDLPGYVVERHFRRNVDVVTGYAKTRGRTTDFPGLGWVVLVRIDQSAIVAPIRIILWKLGVGGMLVVGPLWGVLLCAAGQIETLLGLTGHTKFEKPQPAERT